MHVVTWETAEMAIRLSTVIISGRSRLSMIWRVVFFFFFLLCFPGVSKFSTLNP